MTAMAAQMSRTMNACPPEWLSCDTIAVAAHADLGPGYDDAVLIWIAIAVVNVACTRRP